LIIFVVIVSTGDSGVEKKQEELERRVANLEKAIEKLTQIDVIKNQIGSLSHSLNNLETRIPERLDNLEKRLENLQKNIVEAGIVEKKEKPAGPKTASAKAKTPPETKPETREESSPSEETTSGKPPHISTKVPVKKQAAKPSRIHTVADGETLFSISRHYNLSIEKLRNLNNLKPDDVIHPGEKLIISR
jgi:LysM repeat protein